MEGIFLILGVILGLVFVGICARPAYRSLRRSDWAEVTARVVSATVEQSEKLDGGRPLFGIRLRFDYTFDSASHRGTQYIGDRYLDAKAARDLALAYPVGKAFPLYVYRKDPAETKMFAGAHVAAIVLALGGMALIVFAVYKLSRLA